MMREPAPDAGTPEDYAEGQHHCSQMIFEFLQPHLHREACTTILDVGCGVGATITALAKAGYDAYGIDLPEQARHWAAARHPANRFFTASALHLPFQDDSFDFVYSFGVIEHIGTVLGHCTLLPDYQSQRQQYANEIMRVAKPGARVMIACPNKIFPVDIQHGPGDAAEKAGAIRSFIYNRTGMNVHKTWGQYHLVSDAEVRKLFGVAGARGFTSLPLDGYFGFGRFREGFLKPLARVAEYWVSNMPARARTTFLNPYVMIQIKK